MSESPKVPQTPNGVWSEEFDWPRPIVSPEPEYYHGHQQPEEAATSITSSSHKCKISRFFSNSSTSSNKKTKESPPTPLPLQTRPAISTSDQAYLPGLIGENGRRGSIRIDEKMKVWVKQDFGRPKYLRVAWHAHGAEIIDGDRCTYAVWSKGLEDMAANVWVYREKRETLGVRLRRWFK